MCVTRNPSVTFKVKSYKGEKGENLENATDFKNEESKVTFILNRHSSSDGNTYSVVIDEKQCFILDADMCRKILELC